MNVELVCYANYCRSPVVSKIISNLSKSRIKTSSSGLHPFRDNKMDERSEKFLLDLGLNDIKHYPRQFSESISRNADLILICDINVMFELKEKFKHSSSKMKLISKYTKGNSPLLDPYTCDTYNEYKDVMEQYRTYATDWTNTILKKL